MASTSKKMKAVIFAGGIGTRMWPLSRKATPKQFEPIIEGKSTLQMAVERLRPDFDWQDIYISTGEKYRQLIISQVPNIPKENIIGEPEMRDVAPAVGYLMSILAKSNPDSPVAILWSDHLVENVTRFKEALKAGAEYLKSNPNKFVFIGQRPRFANQNLGWIEYGESTGKGNGIVLKKFISWHYRPDLETASKYFRSGRHAWNPGYFVVTPKFALSQFKVHAPEMYSKLMQLQSTYGNPDHEAALKAIYPTLEKVHFDNAVLEKVTPDQAVVLSVDLGWSDIGTWEALKEALQNHPNENVVIGSAETYDSTNNMLYSNTDQMIAAVGVDDLAIVVTDDVVMVVRQSAIPKIKKMLKKFAGTDKEKYT